MLRRSARRRGSCSAHSGPGGWCAGRERALCRRRRQLQLTQPDMAGKFANIRPATSPPRSASRLHRHVGCLLQIAKHLRSCTSPVGRRTITPCGQLLRGDAGGTPGCGRRSIIGGNRRLRDNAAALSSRTILRPQPRWTRTCPTVGRCSPSGGLGRRVRVNLIRPPPWAPSRLPPHQPGFPHAVAAQETGYNLAVTLIVSAGWRHPDAAPVA